jgi:hypothetical protein
MYEKHILAPGVILYRTGEQSIAGLKDEIDASIPLEQWREARVVNPETYESQVSDERKCHDFILYNYDENLKDLYKKIDDWIYPAYEDFQKEYFIEETTSDMYLILKYENLGKFDSHVDDGGKFPRTISLSAYINDDYEGGEIEFTNFNIKHKPKTGDIILFCSAFPYMHSVTPVTSGTRYAIVNWYRYSTYSKEII